MQQRGTARDRNCLPPGKMDRRERVGAPYVSSGRGRRDAPAGGGSGPSLSVAGSGRRRMGSAGAGGAGGASGSAEGTSSTTRRAGGRGTRTKGGWFCCQGLQCIRLQVCVATWIAVACSCPPSVVLTEDVPLMIPHISGFTSRPSARLNPHKSSSPWGSGTAKQKTYAAKCSAAAWRRC